MAISGRSRRTNWLWRIGGSRWSNREPRFDGVFLFANLRQTSPEGAAQYERQSAAGLEHFSARPVWLPADGIRGALDTHGERDAGAVARIPASHKQWKFLKHPCDSSQSRITLPDKAFICAPQKRQAEQL